MITELTTIKLSKKSTIAKLKVAVTVRAMQVLKSPHK